MRPAQSRADTRAAEAKWARAIDNRDGNKCAMQRLTSRGTWERCESGGTPKLDHAHIFPRRECAKAVFDERGRTGLKACRICHNVLDGMGNHDGRLVRVPPDLELVAAEAVVEASKQVSQRIISILLTATP